MYIVQQGSGSLQNVYKEVVHCKWVLPLQSTLQCISLHCRTFKVVVHTLWHCTAKRVQGGGSLQVSASAQEQLSPTSRSFFSPTNQFFVILITCTVIRGGPRVFHTKTFSSSAFRQSPDILAWKNKFCKPTVFFQFCDNACTAAAMGSLLWNMAITRH